jgi:nucleotide-binding universal stress UspA family protein
MSFSFKTILVPVDFSINSEVAINKALEIADTEAATLHLVHVLDHTFFSLSAVKSVKLARSNDWIDYIEAERMLKQWERSIEESMPSIDVNTWILPAASIQQAIAKKARDLRTDVIVIGKNSSHTLFPFLKTVTPSELAELTGTAVLTVKPGSLHNKMKTAVVPVADNLTQKKTDVIAALCKKCAMKVHLVTFVNGDRIPDGFSASPLLQVYQWLKGTLHCAVEYTVLHGNNKAKAILNYAEKVNADVLLVHPESETRIGWKKHISDVLPSKSKVQVLAVHPAH